VSQAHVTDGIGSRPVRIERPLRAVAVGVSTSPTCGVHDHALLQAEELSRGNLSCSLHWLVRADGSIAAARAEMRAWAGGLARELEQDQPDAVLLHYSVFSYSYRGFPLFVRPTLSALRSLRIPLVTALHEYAYPWGRDGARGTAWALTQRALLLEVMRVSSAVVVAAPFRADWLTSRSWLPHRRIVVAPVFSNLPATSAAPDPHGRPLVLGLFGYSYEAGTIALILDGVRLLQDRGVSLQLRLLGAPGPASASAATWLELSRARELELAPSFSGRLSAQDLSDALASCDVLLFADPSGPTPRKTTLAASLASGRPVVVFDGPRRWPELTQSGAAVAAQPTASSLAKALAGLLEDEGIRDRLGSAGAAFARSEMSVERSAEVVGRLLEDLVSGPRR
jgi:glycosyltransferase involved in cell wall biosynthesis